ncbi:MAG: DUF2935 domain-containing protein [Bacillus sp. (in: firmicutes)]
MADHLGYIRHDSDISNYDVNVEVINMMQKFVRLLMQAIALKIMVCKPRIEMLPALEHFKQVIMKETKSLEVFKLELDDFIKKRAIVTTSSPDLLEHIASEAYHLWRNLEEGIISQY